MTGSPIEIGEPTEAPLTPLLYPSSPIRVPLSNICNMGTWRSIGEGIGEIYTSIGEGSPEATSESRYQNW
jgi:hypothetical protein